MRVIARDIQNPNVGKSERWASVAAGVVLVLWGLSRRSLANLGLAFGGSYLLYRGLTGHCYANEALGVSSAGLRQGSGVNIERSVTVNLSPEDAYRFWRNIERLPTFMKHLQSVQILGLGRSHWVAKTTGPAVEWDAEISEERPNELVAWRSLPGSEIDIAGTVTFNAAPGSRGTEVRVKLAYNPPGGIAGVAVAKLLNAVTSQQVNEDLRRFKQMIEAGEVPTTKCQPSGRANEPDAQSHGRQQPPPEIQPTDEVIEASWESFPTSDAPAWNMGRSERKRD